MRTLHISFFNTFSLYFPRGPKCTLDLLINLSVAEWNTRFICAVYTEAFSPVGKLGFSEQGGPVFSSMPCTCCSQQCVPHVRRWGETLHQGPALPHSDAGVFTSTLEVVYPHTSFPAPAQPLEMRKGCGTVCGCRLHLQTGGAHNRWDPPAFQPLCAQGQKYK